MADIEAAESFSTVYTNAKAGMEMSAEDKARIKRTIFELSKDSDHYKEQQRKKMAADARIEEAKKKAAKATPSELFRASELTAEQSHSLESSRDLTRTWLVVDMDAFFASVEEKHNPALKGRPFAVGGLSMISTASYAARRFGVRSAMPGFIGKALCSELTFVPLNFERYTAASEETREIFKSFDPHFEAGSLDEAYLDITDYITSSGLSSAEVASELRRRVREETGGLTCSCGVGPNMMLAKVAADRQKPDGQFIVGSTQEDVMNFVSTLPVRKVPGIGQMAESFLSSFEVHTCGDIAKNLGLLSLILTPSFLDQVMRAALGLGQTRHTPPVPDNEPNRKGISVERTFTPPLSTKKELTEVVESLVESLCSDMQGEGIEGRTLTLKIKLSNFELKTRSITHSRHMSTASDVAPLAIKLLLSELPLSARLVGVRMSALRKKGFAGPLDKWLGQAGHDLASAVELQEGGNTFEEEGDLETKVPRPEQHQAASPSISLPSTSGWWTCKACTFAENKPMILRCLVCDTLKGMEHHPPAPGPGKMKEGSKRPRGPPEGPSQPSIRDMFRRKE